MTNARKTKPKVFCAICGKPPTEQTVCPNCGLQNICGYHLYKFFGDTKDSPIGCPKCGPRCAVCGAQTELVHHNQRAVCSSCLQVLRASESVKQEQSRRTAEKLQKIFSTLFTVLGIIAGIFLGMQAEFQKLLASFIKTRLPTYASIIIWGTLGLIVGSFLGAIVSSFLKPS